MRRYKELMQQLAREADLLPAPVRLSPQQQLQLAELMRTASVAIDDLERHVQTLNEHIRDHNASCTDMRRLRLAQELEYDGD